ncbi:MAG: sulfur oxidation c-type cytochrome SoxX [Pseudomonadota bacterium]
MKRAISAVVVSACLASPAVSGPIAPGDIPWEDEVAIPVSLSGQDGDIENGKVLMNKGAGNCIACHAVTDLAELQFHGNIGPSLDGVADRWSEAEIRGIVANAKNMFPGTMMPAFYKTDGFTRLGDAYTGEAHEGDVAPLLTAQEVEDLVAYLVTLTE